MHPAADPLIRGKIRIVRIFLIALGLLCGIDPGLCPNAMAQETKKVMTPSGLPVIVVPERYRRAGVLRVATEANYPPFEFVEKKSAEIRGFDIDLGNALGKEMGLKMDWKDTGWDGIVSALVYQKVDLIMSGMTIEEDRKRDRAFTRPYFLSGQVIARRRGNTIISSIDDLRRPGAIVAVQGGTTGETAARKANVPITQIKNFDSQPNALLDVQIGKSEAAVGDLPALRELIDKSYPALETIPGFIGDPEKVGIAARKHDLLLVHALNEALDRLMVNGTYARIYRKWIGDSPRTELISGLDRAKGVGTTIPDSIARAPNEAAAQAAAAAIVSTAPSSLAIRADVLREAMPSLLAGAKITLRLTFVSLLFGVPLGLVIALMRLSARTVIRLIAQWYVEIVRGTPLLLQIWVLYYVLGTPDVGVNLPAFWAGVMALSLNAAAYLAEIFRAGIQSIDSGQSEAARSLGMTHGQSMRYVILPQTLRRVLPPMTNEAVALLKDSSLVSVVALAELMMQGKQLVNNGGSATTIYLGVALLYLCMTLPLTLLVRVLEERWKPVSGGRRSRRRSASAPIR
jgi:His/Glu/Gln/Arg/opine family amino acid ABC transporter permease subunit